MLSFALKISIIYEANHGYMQIERYNPLWVVERPYGRHVSARRTNAE